LMRGFLRGPSRAFLRRVEVDGNLSLMSGGSLSSRNGRVGVLLCNAVQCTQLNLDRKD
jgi:hypothetical protein